MDIKEELDLAIKRFEGVTETEHYRINERKYYNYMSNDIWNTFLNSMSTKAREEYGNGSGGETKETKSPPKMASYGSSSRMIYNSSKLIPCVCFEKKLPTEVGGIANMDAFYDKDESLIFVEAKCREPYGNYSKIIVETKYEDFYRYINGNQKELIIHIEDKTVKRNEKETEVLEVSFEINGKIIEHFDMKQMLSHLLGVGVYLRDNPTERRIKFLYYIYNPQNLVFFDEKAKEKISNIYKCVCKECESVDFIKLFALVIDYLKKGISTKKQIDIMKNNFTFKLCDQETYTNEIQ